MNTERRAFRTARRRLDRRQQRINLLQQLFAKEIGKINPRFFIRLEESTLWPEDKSEKFTLFKENGFTDKEYHELYPTIHHLIDDLMKNDKPHDIRLVYLACAWLVAHRGHFLLNLNADNLSEIKDFNKIYSDFFNYFELNSFNTPWDKECCDKNKLAETLKKSVGVTQKYKELCEFVCNGKKPSKDVSEDFPFSREGILKLLAGGTYKLSDLFGNDDYDELENKSVSLAMDEEKLAAISAEIGDDYDLIAAMRPIYDWALLVNTLAGETTISEAKIDVYEQHKKDLAFLKHIIKTYIPQKYNEIFRVTDKDNYAAYSHHTDEPHAGKWRKNKEEFSKFILEIIKEIEPEADDKLRFEDMKKRLEIRKFMPKQKDSDNRVIPHQLYQYGLRGILKNASEYLPFLNETDEDGISVKDKIEAVFMFRIPYFVGPLNKKSDKAWFVRKAEGKIYPWNFEKMVDLEASEEAFIQKLTNKPAPQHAFRKLIESNILTESDAEKIIARATFAEDKSRLSKWLEKEFPNIKESDRKYICNIKIKDFGRLSRKFLDELQGAQPIVQFSTDKFWQFYIKKLEMFD